jgi:hypothetical protein
MRLSAPLSGAAVHAACSTMLSASLYSCAVRVCSVKSLPPSALHIFCTLVPPPLVPSEHVAHQVLGGVQLYAWHDSLYLTLVCVSFAD